MKIKLFNFLGILSICLAVFASCKKSDSSEYKGSFTWTYQNQIYSATYAKAFSVDDLGPNIIGIVGTPLEPASQLSFKIFPLVTGNYTLDTLQNRVMFVDTEGNYLRIYGNINISSVANKKLSATFTLTAIDTAFIPHSLNGNMIDVPIDQ